MQLLPFRRKSLKLRTSFLVAHRARTDRSSRLALNLTSFARGATHFFNRLLKRGGVSNRAGEATPGHVVFACQESVSAVSGWRTMNHFDTRIPNLGPRTVASPLRHSGEQRFVEDQHRVVLDLEASSLREGLQTEGSIAGFEMAGPRDKILFDPSKTRSAIVTCGGLCPGLNNVVRALVYTLEFSYRAAHTLGIRYGYKGLSKTPSAEPIPLNHRVVEDIHKTGGTFLGSCRGTPPAEEIVDVLENRGIDILFAVGGDGTFRGAQAISREFHRRGLRKVVVGVPKTIDNDLHWVERSFGFTTAVEEAVRAIDAAHQEARGAWNGIGLVKLMGRHSGFIASHASLASGDVNFCLIPEVPFSLEGVTGLLRALEQRLREKGHAVIVVAEGAGQDLVSGPGNGEARDASGNPKLKDIGIALRDRIRDHFAARSVPMDLKYIDPSYIIRSMPACASDAELCSALAQCAVHAGMAGKTNLFIGVHASRYVHVPIEMGIETKKQIDPAGDEWRRVVETTRQPTGLR